MPEPTEDEEGQTASGFMSLLNHYHDASGAGHTDDEYEGLIGKIAVSGGAATHVDGQEMGPTVEVRLFDAECGRLVQLLLTASTALDLVARLAYAATEAYEGEEV